MGCNVTRVKENQELKEDEEHKHNIENNNEIQEGEMHDDKPEKKKPPKIVKNYSKEKYSHDYDDKTTSNKLIIT